MLEIRKEFAPCSQRAYSIRTRIKTRVVKGKYIKSFDKKKGKDGYKAVDLKSALL